MGSNYEKYTDQPTRVSMGKDLEQHKQRGEQLGKTKERIFAGQKVDAQPNFSEKSTRLTDKEIGHKLEELINCYIASYGEKEEQELRKFANQYNIDVEMYKASDAGDKNDSEKLKPKVARMIFNGGVEKPIGGYSKKIAEVLNPKKNSFIKKSPPEDYNLADSSVWKVMSQYSGFKKMEDKMKQVLSNMKIPPNLLADMKINDFRHILFEHFGHNKKSNYAKLFPQLDKEGNIVRSVDAKGNFKEVFKSPKQENIQRFIREEEESFRKILMRQPGINAKYVEALIKKMKLEGSTDMTREVVEGHPEWKNQPFFDMHHIINIKDCKLLEAQGKSFLDVNKYENMCLMCHGSLDQALDRRFECELDPDAHGHSAHDIIHKGDITFKNKKKWGENDPENIPDEILRLQPKPGIRFMMSYNENDIIYDKKHLKQLEKEKRKAETKARLQGETR